MNSPPPHRSEPAPPAASPAQHTPDEQMEEARYHQLPPPPADSAGRAPEKKKEDSCLAIITAALPGLVVLCGIAANVYLFMVGMDTTPDPRLYVRLVAVEGLGAADPCVPPLFELAVDVDRIPEEAFHRGPLHVGGGDAMLRVSYRGVILAWGGVPQFTIDVRRLGRSAAGVATVVARAEGSVVRQEMRSMIWAEQRAFGRVEFDVDGELPSLGGHLRCKTYVFRGQPTEALPPCWVQKKVKYY